MILFRVKSKTDIKKLAGAIFTNIRNCDEIELSCLGAGSLNQAIKSTIVASSMTASIGCTLMILPSFDITEVDEQEKTIIRLIIKKIRI